MNIMELLNSTYKLGERRQPSFVFSKKSFGSIFAFNKSVVYKPNNSIVEITMYIAATTELNKTAHKVSVALQGITSTEYSTEDLLNIIRMQTKYNKMQDEEILERIYAEEDIINGKFIIQSGSNRNKMLLIDKRVPLTSQIRVKCTCFTGDTKVLLSNGSYRTLKELEGKKNFNIIAYNKNIDSFQIATAVKCELKKKNSKVLEITLSDNTIIKSTPEHRFLNSKRQWIEAANLKKGDSLKSIINEDLSKIKKHVSTESYYTYLYLDPRKKGRFIYNDIEVEYEPFYVGIGSGIVRDIDSNKCYTRMSEIYQQGYNPIIVKQDVCVDKHVAVQLKEKLINNIGIRFENKGPLLNRKIIEEAKKYKSSKSYKIKSIEESNIEEDVFCITTEGLGNFILQTEESNSGIVVENCSDYYYTFAWYNSEHRVNIGMKPPRYTPYRKLTKKDTDFRPVRNPNRHPGVCKHLLLFIALLMNGRVLNPSNQLMDSFLGNKKKMEIYKKKDISLMLSKVNKELKEANLKIREQRQALKDYDRNEKRSK